MKYFVMLVGADGKPLPMMDDDGSVHLFDSEEDAEAAGMENILGGANGYEVYPWD
jgi:hypothetical protein